MLRFKQRYIESEFKTLKRRNAPLTQLMLDLTEYVHGELKKDVVITHLLRSKRTQESIYGKNTKRISPHMLWQAVDIRDRIYTPDQKLKIVTYLKNYDLMNRAQFIPAANSRTVWVHQVGLHGMHFHIQYIGAMVYNFYCGATISSGKTMDSTGKKVDSSSAVRRSH